MAEARWNVFLINRGEEPMCYMANLTEDEAQYYMVRALSKAFDGSDADGFCVMRSDYPVPRRWPGSRGR